MNRDAIFSLVKNHFSLKEESLQEFKKILYEGPFIPEHLKKFADDNFRIRIKLEEELLEKIDKSWKNFKHIFKEINVPYNMYRRGKIDTEKGEMKLFKYILSFYLENKEMAGKFCERNDIFIRSIRSYIVDVSEDIGASKFPEGELEAVISWNFNDWFLCSSGEKWTSCLNLESNYEGSYWSDLPGLIADKNRAMLYITNGTKKAFERIVSERTIFRTFITLLKNDDYYINRWYPKDPLCAETKKLFFKLFKGVGIKKFGCVEEESSVLSKYPITNLFFTVGKSCFPFLDFLKFAMTERGTIYITPSFDKGHFYFDENFRFGHSQVFNINYDDTCGLPYFIENNTNLQKENIARKRCSCCEELVYEEEIFYFETRPYCENCYHNNFFYCQNCNEVFRASELMEDEETGEFLCENCWSKTRDS